ncbi:MAG: hypothetical protein R3242_05415, partial [Akkermansiaceae bacterium]|nr:hypothetical protein [Akkermansiaceae bacterium]
QRAIYEQASHWCNEQGVPIAKLALQFACHSKDFHTTMFSTARLNSLRRNLKWIEEPYEEELIRGVRKILEPVMDHQWDYDAGVDKVN